MMKSVMITGHPEFSGKWYVTSEGFLASPEQVEFTMRMQKMVNKFWKMVIERN